jgi:hypothetical protein
MNVSPSVAQLQREHIVMELECIDRMYLNAYIPKLTSEAGIAGFLRGHLGYRFASTKQAGAMTNAFIRRIREFLKENQVPSVPFKKGQRKDDVFKKRLKRFKRSEGVVFVGVAQEKARVPRTIRKRFGEGGSIPWIDYTTADSVDLRAQASEVDCGCRPMSDAHPQRGSDPFPARLLQEHAHCIHKQNQQPTVR